MASLDKAFIKAYRRQDFGAGAIPIDTSGTQSLAEALEDRPLREAKEQAEAARHQGVLAAIQTERAQVQLPPAVGAPAPSTGSPKEEGGGLEVSNEAMPPFLRVHSDEDSSRTKAGKELAPDESLEPERNVRVDAGLSGTAQEAKTIPVPHMSLTVAGGAGLSRHGPTGSEAAAPVADGGVDEVSPDTPDEPSGTVEQGPLLASYPTGSAAAVSSGEEPPAVEPGDVQGEEDSQARPFQPLLQIDRITLSPVGERLQQQAAAELDHLAEALLGIAEKGRKVVGFTSDNTGHGTTTLLSCVALRLAERGVSVALVDANLADPQLASELALLPEYGWERAMAAPVPIEELVIESVDQPLAFMPLCHRFDDADVPEDFVPFREAVATLREHYELVLVDLGVPGDMLVRKMVRALDTVLLVCDVRKEERESMVELHRTLSRAGVNVAGMVESFVRGE